MKSEELTLIYGGVTINNSILNTLIRFVTTAYELGRSLGSAIRRSKDDIKCI